MFVLVQIDEPSNVIFLRSERSLGEQIIQIISALLASLNKEAEWNPPYHQCLRKSKERVFNDSKREWVKSFFLLDCLGSIASLNVEFCLFFLDTQNHFVSMLFLYYIFFCLSPLY